MTMIARLIVLIVTIFSLAGWSGMAHARDSASDPWLSEVKQEGMSLEDAVAMVQAQTGGRVLSAEAVTVDGRVVYRIKVLTPSGRVSVYQVDAATGQIL